MIANLTATGWEIIYHRAHALLAAQLGGQWKRSESPLRLYETIAAISHPPPLGQARGAGRGRQRKVSPVKVTAEPGLKALL